MSGIEVDSSVPTLFNEIKLRSVHKFATFKIENKKKIVVDYLADPVQTEDREKDKAEFDKLKDLVTASKEPRYILYDFGFTNKEGRKISKIAFIFWYVYQYGVCKKILVLGLGVRMIQKLARR